MSNEKEPWEIPAWHSIRRESVLVRHLIGSGATALGRANYADQTGEYYTAFFGLSIGLERLAKLTLVADHAISNAGAMPAEKLIRNYGHKLIDLLDAADEVGAKHSLTLRYSRPTSAVSKKIIDCLDAFADAARGRYANFAALGDPNLTQAEPIRKWWGDVAELILKEHNYGRSVQKRVESRAHVVDALMSPISLVHYFNESGDAMQEVLTASIRTGQTEQVQKYGRYYALTIVRWLAELFSKAARSASDTHRVHAFHGAWEHFQTYTLGDDFLKSRKNWPLN